MTFFGNQSLTKKNFAKCTFATIMYHNLLRGKGGRDDFWQIIADKNVLLLLSGGARIEAFPAYATSNKCHCS